MTVRLFGLSLLPPSARKARLLKTAALRTLGSARSDGPGELNIVFLGKNEMLKMNKRYLHHDYDTDVISFPYRRGASPKGTDAPFGDVFVSAHQAGIQAKQLGHSVLTEVLTLIIHGTLHLLGYEDTAPEKKAAMFRRQEILLAKLK